MSDVKSRWPAEEASSQRKNERENYDQVGDDTKQKYERVEGNNKPCVQLNSIISSSIRDVDRTSEEIRKVGLIAAASCQLLSISKDLAVKRVMLMRLADI